MNFANKVAIVTGGARDIGRATSIKLASLGASVSLNYFDNPDDAKETVQTIQSKGGKAIAVQGDMTKPDDIQRLVVATQEAFGKTAMRHFEEVENPAQGQVFLEDQRADFGRQQRQTHAVGPEFHGLLIAVEPQDDLAEIEVAAAFAVQHFDMDVGPVEGFERGGHVVQVHEEFPVRFRDPVAGDPFDPGQGRTRADVELVQRIGKRTHPRGRHPGIGVRPRHLAMHAGTPIGAA